MNNQGQESRAEGELTTGGEVDHREVEVVETDRTEGVGDQGMQTCRV